MTGILLAAGVGSRLRPHTDSLPKCLLPVGREALLPRSLRALRGAGITECVLVTGYLHALVQDAVATLHLPITVRFVHNAQYASTNNNYSLWLALQSEPRDDVLVLDADILFDPRLLDILLSDAAPDALLMRRDDGLGPEEIKVEVERGFVRKIGKGVPPSRAAGESIGIERFSRTTAEKLATILEHRRDRNEFYEASFQDMIDAGVPIAAIPTRGLACMEIDTPEDLRAACALAASAGL
jgi:choline kinase